MPGRNWPKIKNDYMNGMSLRDVAQKHGMGYDALREVVSRKKWPAEKIEEETRLSQKLTEKRHAKIEMMAETELELKRIEKETGFELLRRIGVVLKKKTLTPYQIESLSKTYGNLFTRLYKSFGISDIVKVEHSVETQHSILFEIVDRPKEKAIEEIQHAESESTS